MISDIDKDELPLNFLAVYFNSNGAAYIKSIAYIEPNNEHN